jgi:tetraacyldisaccharide 4'-kinase
LLLLPLSWIYAFITSIRNWLYDQGLYKSYQASVPVINIGNLTVGGTGKTPHAEYLIRFLTVNFPDKKIAVLSRGYGRKTKGFILAHEKTVAGDIGDEPMQFYRKFGKNIIVAVCEKRPMGIQKILDLFPETNIILLDDAYQHRPVKPSFNILLTDSNRLFYKDFPFPAGLLRESRQGAKRADCVIITKTNTSLSDNFTEKIVKKIKKYTNPETPVFFTGIKYGNPVSFAGNEAIAGNGKKVVLVSGIAKAQPFEKYISENFVLANHLVYPDHHSYTIQDIEKISQTFRNEKADIVLTTEKDFVKLKELTLPVDIPFYYLPIEIIFQKNEEDFRELIRKIAE